MKSKQILGRILVLIIGIFAAFVFPWWVASAIALIGLTWLAAYEVVVIGVILDALSGASIAGFLGVEFVFTICFVIVAVIRYGIEPYVMRS